MDKLTSNEAIKNLCLELLKCETADGITDILKKNKLWDNMEYWRFYGDQSNNISTINNQAPDAEKALVEKMANSFDARLMLECKKRGINPKDRDSTPKNIKEAMNEYFYKGDKFNTFMSLENETVIFATGSKKEPCISLVDKGEGQTPNSVPETFLSLGKENKEGILFTQGRYNQGGSGSVNFCKNGISLLITRRCPDINDETGKNKDHWSFTVTRKASAKERKLPEPCYLYLAPLENGSHKKGILSFKSDALKLLPEAMNPYSKELEYGSLLKFYGYAMRGANSNIVFDFMYNTEIMMPDAIMPVRLHECRDDYKKNINTKNFRTQVTSFQGFKYRNSENKALEAGFPLSLYIDFMSFRLSVDVYAFRYDKDASSKNLASTRKRKNEGVIFCLGGQHYGELSSDFFRRKNVGLDYLKNDLIVIVDCSSIDGDLKNELFKTDKSTVKDTPQMRTLEAELENLLRDNPKLEELKNIRRKQKVEEKLSDEKPFEDLLSDVLKKNPALASLFNLGPRLSNPWLKDQKGNQEGSKDKKLQYFPSFFKFQKNITDGEIYKRTGNINKRLRFDFETDAVNDYFTREKEPGEYSLDIELIKANESKSIANEEKIFSQYLNNGHWVVSVKIPDDAEEGDKLKINFNIKDIDSDGWTLISEVEIIGPAETKTHQKNKTKQNQGKRDYTTGFDLPNVTWVVQNEWDEYKFDEHSALAIINAENKKINGKDVQTWDFFLNRDNIYLNNELKTNKKNLDEDIILNRYKLSIVFFALSTIEYYNKKNLPNLEDEVSRLTSGISSVLLDVIDSVGDLSESVE